MFVTPSVRPPFPMIMMETIHTVHPMTIGKVIIIRIDSNIILRTNNIIRSIRRARSTSIIMNIKKERNMNMEKSIIIRMGIRMDIRTNMNIIIIMRQTEKSITIMIMILLTGVC